MNLKEQESESSCSLDLRLSVLVWSITLVQSEISLQLSNGLLLKFSPEGRHTTVPPIMNVIKLLTVASLSQSCVLVMLNNGVTT